MAEESSLTLGVAQFREERFIESDPDRIGLIKIGEYVRTPLYEPSMRSMCISLTEVRHLLKMERLHQKKLDAAWKAATKVFQVRSSFLRTKFQEADEYCIALICFTLEEPQLYQEFTRLCQDLVTNTWCYFPYKSLFYLIIGSEMRMKFNDDTLKFGAKDKIRQPITITTGLDYSIDEEDEDANGSESEGPTRIIHSSVPMTLRNVLRRVYLGFAFPVSETEFQPRTLVAFSHIMPSTLDGTKLIKFLEEKNKRVTLIEIDQLSWSSRYIASISVFPAEKEVLIWPWIKFYVEERKMIRTNVEKIILKPTSRSFASPVGTGVTGETV